MKVRARFKGKNGSIGFEKHTRYILRFSITIDDKVRIINLDDGSMCCEYDSLRLFLDNWTVLK